MPSTGESPSSNMNPAPGHRFADDLSVMHYALRLAREGLGRVEPNPLVGAVIVDAKLRFVAGGWHTFFGADHAEIAAIRAAESTSGMRLFVTLEPCDHHGQAPPCTEAVIRAGFRQVVVGCQDPAPHVSGRGLERLRAAGIDVVVGICGQEAQQLIAPFEMLQCEDRPWVHAKWAMTLDGRIATSSGHSQWISGSESRREVHRLRGRMDAIITGAGTVRTDDPALVARPSGPRTPFRIVLDATGNSVRQGSQLAETFSESPVIVAISEDQPADASGRLEQMGLEVLRLPQTAPGKICIKALLSELGRRQMTNVLIEAGSGIHGSFFDEQLVDEVHVFVAPKLTGGDQARSPVGGIGLDRIPVEPSLHSVSLRRTGDDFLVEGRVVREEGSPALRRSPQAPPAGHDTLTG